MTSIRRATPPAFHLVAIVTAVALTSPGCYRVDDDDIGEGPSDTDGGTEDTHGDDAATTQTHDDPVDDTGTDAAPVCGNGVVDLGEVCDDGLNDGSYDGCASDCRRLAPHCGDGKRDHDDGEACDDGVNDGSYGGCMPDCVAWAGYCGDGIVEDPETCESDDNVGEDGCNPTCGASGAPMWSDSWLLPEMSALHPVAMGMDLDGRILVFANGVTRGAPDWRRMTFDHDTGASYSYGPSQPGQASRGSFTGNGGWVIAGATSSGNGFIEYTVDERRHGTLYGSFGPLVAGAMGPLGDRVALVATHQIQVRAFDNLTLWSYDTTPLSLSHAAFMPDGRLITGGTADIFDDDVAYALSFDATGDQTSNALVFPNPDGGASSLADLVVADDGSVYATGTVSYAGQLTPHLWVGRFDANLDEEWIVSDPMAAPGRRPHAITVTETGTIAVVGDNIAAANGFVEKFSADGELRWSRDYDGATTLTAVMPTAQGGLVIAGDAPDRDGTTPMWIARVHP